MCQNILLSLTVPILGPPALPDLSFQQLKKHQDFRKLLDSYKVSGWTLEAGE